MLQPQQTQESPFNRVTAVLTNFTIRNETNFHFTNIV